MAARIPTHPLLNSDGKPIPLLGFGTAEFPLGSSPHAQEAIVHAIELGYRHFDTASVYRSENQLGKAIAQSIDLGLIKSRDELFITSKLWIADAHRDRVLPALRKSLEYVLDRSVHRRSLPFVSFRPASFSIVWFSQEYRGRLPGPVPDPLAGELGAGSLTIPVREGTHRSAGFRDGVGSHGGMPPFGPREEHRGLQLLSRQARAASQDGKGTSGRKPGGDESIVAARTAEGVL